MPVVDWTRTDLLWRLPSTGYALRFDAVDFAAYDVFILRRPGAEADHRPDVLARARARVAAMGEGEQATARADDHRGPARRGRRGQRPGPVRAAPGLYAGMTAADLRANHAAFLRAVVPVAEEAGVRLAVHPDDPPFPLFGLPRVVSTATDLRARARRGRQPRQRAHLLHGLARLPRRQRRAGPGGEFAPHVHFAHLRNVTTEPDGSFYEAEHLDGGTDMVAVIGTLLAEEARRGAEIPDAPGPWPPARRRYRQADQSRATR